MCMKMGIGDRDSGFFTKYKKYMKKFGKLCTLSSTCDDIFLVSE